MGVCGAAAGDEAMAGAWLLRDSLPGGFFGVGVVERPDAGMVADCWR